MGQKSHSCFIRLAGLFSVQRGPRRVQVNGIPTTRDRTNLTKRNCRSLPLQCCFGPTAAFSQQIPARAKKTLPRFPRGNLRRRGHDTVRFGIVPSFAPPPLPPGDNAGGFEWFWGGKINARFCKRLPRLAPQLCHPGGRGGRAKLGTETESSVPAKMKPAARPYQGMGRSAYCNPLPVLVPGLLPGASTCGLQGMGRPRLLRAPASTCPRGPGILGPWDAGALGSWGPGTLGSWVAQCMGYPNTCPNTCQHSSQYLLEKTQNLYHS